MEKIWLKSYPPGVPAEIRYDEYKSIGALVEASVKKYAERPAYHNMGKTMTFADLDRLTRNFGAWLQAKGLGKGARVAIMMPNVLQYPVALFGTLRAGCVVVNVNPLYTARELEHQLNDSGAEVIVILENFASMLQQVVGRTKLKHVVVAALGDLLGLEGRDRQLRRAPREEDGAGVRAAERAPVQRRHRRGRAPRAEEGRGRPRRHRVPAVHRRHHRRREGRDAAPPQHRRQPARWSTGGEAVPRRRASRSSSPRCRCTTSSRSPGTASPS